MQVIKDRPQPLGEQFLSKGGIINDLAVNQRTEDIGHPSENHVFGFERRQTILDLRQFMQRRRTDP